MMRHADLPGLDFERDLWAQGVQLIGGIDEAGRGALAGPVAAAVVVLPSDSRIADTLSLVRDSKLLTAPQRERAAAVIKAQAVAWGVGFADAAEIDSLGILPSTRLAVIRAVGALPFLPQYFLFDYLHWPDLSNPHIVIPKGERHSLSIAAASILAKTARDSLLCDLDGQYPGYGLARHKGYGTQAHRDAIQRLGPSPIHRVSFLG